MTYRVICGDCLDVLPTLPDASVDAIISDPPYPCIKRSYGYWAEDEWAAMMHKVVRESRRILKTNGSAVFVLQPNSRKVGSMRAWLWEFMAWCCREWNMVQDVWWWNTNTIPNHHTDRRVGLMRPSVKACVWLGEPDCHKNQSSILWSETEANVAKRACARAERQYGPSGQSSNEVAISNAATRRGGVTPYNLLPIKNNGTFCTGAITGHGAGTPLALCDWWVRYIVPDGGVVCDPFAGTSTVGVAAVKRGCHYIGIEKHQEWVDVSNRRLSETQPALEMVAV